MNVNLRCQRQASLYAERQQDPQTKFWKPTGIVRDREGGNIVEPAYWLESIRTCHIFCHS